MRWLDSVIEATNMNLTTLGGSGRQEDLVCSGPWGHEESDTTKQLRTTTTMKKLALIRDFLYLG